MKYLVMLYVTYSDSTADKKAMYDEATEANAIADFHKYMGQYVNASNVKTVCCMAINNIGGIYKNESWSVPQTEAEAE